MDYFIGQVLPYWAVVVFAAGMIYRLYNWLKIPAPFAITLFPFAGTGGRGSFNAIKEIIFFSRLFRTNKLLWLLAWLMHGSLALIIIGHISGIYFLREQFVLLALTPDASRQLSMILSGVTGSVFVISLIGLLVRRIGEAEVRITTKISDIIDLLWLLAIAVTGFLMRYPEFHGPELPQVRDYLAGLLALKPGPLPDSPLFSAHVLLVSLFAMYIPFSKVVHMAGSLVIHNLITERPPVYPTSGGLSGPWLAGRGRPGKLTDFRLNLPAR